MLKLLLVGAWAVCCLRRQCLTYSIVQSKKLNIAGARKFVKRFRDPWLKEFRKFANGNKNTERYS